MYLFFFFVDFVFFFFFQAEDGIRDLVRSRGLGDVYKRQGVRFLPLGLLPWSSAGRVGCVGGAGRDGDEWRVGRLGYDSGAVSYTHLTLPTSDLV